MNLNRQTPISKIPYSRRKKLVYLLDASRGWEKIMPLIKEKHDPSKDRFDELFRCNCISAERAGRSPTEELLRDWQTQMATIQDLMDVLCLAQLHEPANFISEEVLGDGPLRPFQPLSPHNPNKPDSDIRPRVVPPHPYSQPQTQVNGDYLMDTAFANYISGQVESFISAQSDNSLCRYSYTDLELYTDMFSCTPLESGGRFLGKGAFGEVYLGVIKQPDRDVELVAVKRFFKKTFENFKHGHEISNLSSVNITHPNLVMLKGMCTDSCFCIIYEYMDGGNLEERLEKPTEEKPRLTASQRISVAVDVAKGLNYLHTLSPPVVHRDIKSANILLTTDLVAKVGDFGIARVQSLQEESYTNCTNTAVGTTAYMAPEAMRGYVSTKGDVYSYGVVLMELLCARGPLYTDAHGGKQAFLEIFDDEDADVDKLVDKNCDWTADQIEVITTLAEKCSQKKHKRPDMSEILDSLKSLTVC